MDLFQKLPMLSNAADSRLQKSPLWPWYQIQRQLRAPLWQLVHPLTDLGSFLDHGLPVESCKNHESDLFLESFSNWACFCLDARSETYLRPDPYGKLGQDKV
jgi:hypothetical protein